MQGINVGKVEDIMNECNEWSMDIMCLTETQMREHMEIDSRDLAYHFISKGRSKQVRKGGGVAVMWKKDAKIDCEIMDIGNCEMSEDLLVVKLECVDNMEQKITLYVCVCYMSVEGAVGREENQRKYEILKKFVDEHRNEKIIVVGDMNGHVGILGEEVNRNGMLLRDACDNMSLEMLNETIAEGRVTWQGREHRSAIDYVLVNENAREKVLSLWIDEDQEFDIGSDHNLLLVRYDCEVKEAKQVQKRKSKWKLRNANWERFGVGMNEVVISEESSVENMSEEIVGAVETAARRHIGRTKGGARKVCRNMWWCPSIKEERRVRKNLNKVCRDLRKRMERGEDVGEDVYENAWKSYKMQQKVKIMIKNARAQQEREKLDDMKAKGEEGSREWFRYLRGDKVDNKVEEIIVNGRKIKDMNEIASEIKAFWEDIGGMNVGHPPEYDIGLRINEMDMRGIEGQVERREVQKVLKHLKNGKAAGMDGLPYEMFKCGGENLVGMLVMLYNAVLHNERVPCKWNESRVVLMHKGGHKSKKELKNYRPIALMDTIGKIFCMIVNERLRECVEMNGLLSDEQNGFRKNRRGEDNIFIVRELLDACKRENRKGYFAFLDIEKAYDRVNREILCKVLSKCGMSQKMVNIIRSMYVNTRARYMLGDIESDWVESKRGVRQGCILSPLLFALYTEELALRVKESGLGMAVGNEKLSILMYADDIIIMSDSSDELQELLNVVNGYGEDFCVSFSQDKSQVMVINGDVNERKEWRLGDRIIKRTDEYKYLGVTLNTYGVEKAKSEKIFKANQWYGRLASVARYRANKYVTVRELWKTLAVPSIMYGMNVLNWSEHELQKLEVIQNKVERVALGANRYACVEAIRGDMGWSSFSERSMKGNIMYKVRIERMDDERWVKKVYKCSGRHSKWLKSCKRLVRRCGLNCREDVFGCGHVAGWNVVCMNGEGWNWSMDKWKKTINSRVSDLGLRKWKKGMEDKCTMEWYRVKEVPKYEPFYDGSYGSELLFKVRSQSLEVNGRTYRWNVDGSKECKVCGNCEVESVYHMFVECEGYERERQVLIQVVRAEIGGSIFDDWHDNDREGMCVLLGISDVPNGQLIEAVKEFLERVWNIRKLSDHTRLNVLVNDHQYGRVQE